jgi:TPR repeat protein
MPQAQYILAWLLSENLVVGRNSNEAYRWMKSAADSGFTPAQEALAEYQKGEIQSGHGTPDEHGADRGNSSTNPSSFPPRPTVPDSTALDSTGEPDDAVLAKEAFSESAGDRRNGAVSEGGPAAEVGARVRILLAAAEAGSPEALTLIGRWYETGTMVEQDEVLASVCYLRAMRNDSPRAPGLLWKLMRKDGYFERLAARVRENDPAARFVWAGLVVFGFDRQVSEPQALDFLQTAAGQGYNEAVLELGLCHYAGRWVPEDREKGISFLRQAADEGSREARVRLWMIALGSGDRADGASLVDSLHQAIRAGSVQAQAMLGYCLQKGIGLGQNPAKAAQMYRTAAQRGSTAAWNALKGMYDGIRPTNPEFQISE